MSCPRAWQVLPVLFAFALHGALSRADIFRFDTGEVIPGTEGIVPGPGIDLDNWNLTFADLSGRDLTAAGFSMANLAGANFGNATLANADFTRAIVTDAYFAGVRDLRKEQIYSTENYQAKNLRGIGLGKNDLTGWDFDGQNLTS